MAFRSRLDIVSHFFGSMYPRQIYFTGSSRFDGTIRGLLPLPYGRSADQNRQTGILKTPSTVSPQLTQPLRFFLICSTLIKLCRIKRKIKGGSEPFLDRINWDA